MFFFLNRSEFRQKLIGTIIYQVASPAPTCISPSSNIRALNFFWTQNLFYPKKFLDQIFFWCSNFFFHLKIFLGTQIFFRPTFFQTQNFFWPKINFIENDLWRDKTELLSLRLSKQPSTKVLLKLELDTKDQVMLYFEHIIWYIRFVDLVLYVPLTPNPALVPHVLYNEKAATNQYMPLRMSNFLPQPATIIILKRTNGCLYRFWHGGTCPPTHMGTMVWWAISGLINITMGWIDHETPESCIISENT